MLLGMTEAGIACAVRSTAALANCERTLIRARSKRSLSRHRSGIFSPPVGLKGIAWNATTKCCGSKTSALLQHEGHPKTGNNKLMTRIPGDWRLTILALGTLEPRVPQI
jgi:hypothetical protein